MSDIFISYARSTATQAEQVAEALRALGYGVWRDDELPAHRAFADVIEERLAAAKAVVVIWSEEASRSEWVRSEASRAREDHKLVQLIIDEARRPMPFDQIQCADLRGWAGDTDAPGWRKVVGSIAELVGEATAKLLQPVAPPAATPAEPLLAVLAFDNLSGEADLAWFTDGVSEEILQTVARGADLRVIGRTSSFHYRGADKVVPRLAAELKATHVLDGSVRRSGPRVRISAQLIECAHETTLWSDRFDRELSDIFALQDEIAGAVAAALKVAFARAGQAGPIDPAAYELYLKTLEARQTLLDPRERALAIKRLEEATQLSPRFARAWQELALARVNRLRFDKPEEPYAVLCAQVVEAAETALRLDPKLGGAYQALSRLEPFACYLEREALHERALAVAPNNPLVLSAASYFFAELGRVREALGFADQARALDPASSFAAYIHAFCFDFEGGYEESRALWNACIARWPDVPMFIGGALGHAVRNSDWLQMERVIKSAEDRGLVTGIVATWVQGSRAVRDKDPEMLRRTLARAREALDRTGSVSMVELLGACNAGWVDEAFELIDQASFAFMFDPQQRWPSLRGYVFTETRQIFSIIRNGPMMRDPRFPRLCAKLGLVDYWVKTERWPDCAEDGVLPYDFKAECRRLATE